MEIFMQCCVLFFRTSMTIVNFMYGLGWDKLASNTIFISGCFENASGRDKHLNQYSN